MKYIVIFILFFPLQSCKNKLTREEAKEKIIQKNNLPISETKEVGLSFTKEYTRNFMDTQNIPLPDKDEKLIKLEQAEIITYSLEQISSVVTNETWWEEGLGYRCNNDEQRNAFRQRGINPVYTLNQTYIHNAVLTSKGKQYSIDGLNFIIATTDFGEIEGILENNNQAEVIYTKKYIPNEIGTLLFNKQPETTEHKVIFIKNNNMWQIE